MHWTIVAWFGAIPGAVVGYWLKGWIEKYRTGPFPFICSECGASYDIEHCRIAAHVEREEGDTS